MTMVMKMAMTMMTTTMDTVRIDHAGKHRSGGGGATLMAAVARRVVTRLENTSPWTLKGEHPSTGRRIAQALSRHGMKPTKRLTLGDVRADFRPARVVVDGAVGLGGLSRRMPGAFELLQ